MSGLFFCFFLPKSLLEGVLFVYFAPVHTSNSSNNLAGEVSVVVFFCVGFFVLNGVGVTCGAFQKNNCTQITNKWRKTLYILFFLGGSRTI